MCANFYQPRSLRFCLKLKIWKTITVIEFNFINCPISVNLYFGIQIYRVQNEMDIYLLHFVELHKVSFKWSY